MVRVCAYCGGAMERGRRGPLPMFCSGACRQAAYRRRRAGERGWLPPAGAAPTAAAAGPVDVRRVERLAMEAFGRGLLDDPHRDAQGRPVPALRQPRLPGA